MSANGYSSSKLSLSTGNAAANGASNDHSSRNYTLGRKTADSSSHSNKNPFNSVTASIASPTSASSAFGLGTGAFASFGASKTPKTPGTGLDFGALGMGNKPSTAAKEPAKDGDQAEARLSKTSGTDPQTAVSAPSEALAPRTTVDTWVFWCRPPMQKNNGYAVKYEDTISSMAKFNTDLDFVAIFGHLKHPSEMPIVWEYHLFKEGIRPIWEDEENRKGGKWVIRLAKGVADRCWENLQFNLVADSWGELGEEICGGVVSMRSGEDVLSLWLRDANSGKNLKIRYVPSSLILG